MSKATDPTLAERLADAVLDQFGSVVAWHSDEFRGDLVRILNENGCSDAEEMLSGKSDLITQTARERDELREKLAETQKLADAYDVQAERGVQRVNALRKRLADAEWRLKLLYGRDEYARLFADAERRLGEILEALDEEVLTVGVLIEARERWRAALDDPKPHYDFSKAKRGRVLPKD